jgi:hypothetical protein
MRLAMPFVWDERCLAHEPRTEVWVGIATPAAETAARIEAIRAALAIEECRRDDPALERPRDSRDPDHRAACILA